MLGQPRTNQFDPDNRLWTIDVVIDKDTIKKLKTEGLGWKLKKTEQKVSDIIPEGADFIKFKRSEFYLDRKSGEKLKNKPIEVVDSKGKPWNQDELIGNGSVVNVRFRTYEGFKKQTQAMIDAIQVVKLVPYEAKEPFPVEEELDDSIADVGEDDVIV